MSERWGLPRGWSWATIGDIGTVVGGGTPKASDPSNFCKDGVRWLTPADLTGFSESRIGKGARDLTDKGLAESSATVMPPGAVLFTSRAPIGYCAIAANPIATNQGFKSVVPSNGIESEYLRFYLLASKEYAEKNASGTTFLELSGSRMKALHVPVAPLNEQRRIVAKIEALQARSAAAKEALDAIPPLLDQFRQSVLAAAFRGDLTGTANRSRKRAHPPIVIAATGGRPPEDVVPKGWRWEALTTAAVLESGHTPRKSVPEYWDGGGVPWICLKDIRAAHGKVIDQTLMMPTMAGIKNSSARILPTGTVCFSRDISVGYVTIMGREMATTQHFANWICGPELHNRYLMYAFMAARPWLLTSGEGTTVKTIYMPALKRMHVLLPPMEEQVAIAAKLDKLLGACEAQEKAISSQREELDGMDQSILAKAFRGELVPQDPNDEPANELLERIRAELGTTAKQKRKLTSQS